MSLKAFMKQNVKIKDNKFVPISERMIDEKTKEPVLWEIKQILEKESSKIKEECIEYDYSKSARKSGRSVKFNSSLFTRRVMAASVVYPDLKNAELQASYGVIGDDELLGTMLFSDEFTLLQEEVDDFDGQISKNLEDEKEVVKNS